MGYIFRLLNIISNCVLWVTTIWKGKTVRVYYNPDKPKQAVLVPGDAGLNFGPYIFAGVFILLGVGIATRLRKQTVGLGNRE